MNNNSNAMGIPIKGLFSNHFVVPLYQRNFAWRTDEIQQFLQDIWDAFQKNKGDYYIGSLVVMRRHDGSFEVVDGQQRLTVISLIAILMGRLTRPVLFYDSRPEVQKFFEILRMDSGKTDTACTLPEPSLFYLKEACEFIKNSLVEQPVTKEDKTISYTQVSFLHEKEAEIADYFMDHVVLVCNVVPEDTDVAAYFEIMNNRGEQLQKHEIVKAQMMATITDKRQRDEFAKIWDACSQMDVPIQRLFLIEDRKKYFGDHYDSFCFCDEDGNSQSVESDSQYSFDDIFRLDDSELKVCMTNKDPNKENYTMEIEDNTYGSIIDFPNFLMHVLKLYLSKKNGKEYNVPLNEKELLNEYRTYRDELSSFDFVKHLLFCRTVFDRFVVKSVAYANDSDDGRRWVMRMPKMEGENWYYVSSFGDEKGNMIVKAISMLQVTFRTRIYKTWLYDVLFWLYGKCRTKDSIVANFSLDAKDYLMYLHDWMCNYYSKLLKNLEKQNIKISKIDDGIIPSEDNSYSPGTSAPYFLLNFIDYLYFCKCKNCNNCVECECCDGCNKSQKVLKDFEFKYWNSVEHHLAQNKADDESKQYVNNLGNLCLINRNSNSRLSDRVVQEKVEFYADKNMGPNRQVIYAMTKNNNYKWGGEQIAKHYNEIVVLLADCRGILGLPPLD